MANKMIVGNLETCHLPDLGIKNLHVRIDTGAQTSSLHVDNIKKTKENGILYVTFDIHPDSHDVAAIQPCKSPLQGVKRIKSSNGEIEKRYVINTKITMGDKTWMIEINLTNRADMSYLMLLGRQAMQDKILVDPSETFLLS